MRIFLESAVRLETTYQVLRGVFRTSSVSFFFLSAGSPRNLLISLIKPGNRQAGSVRPRFTFLAVVPFC